MDDAAEVAPLFVRLNAGTQAFSGRLQETAITIDNAWQAGNGVASAYRRTGMRFQSDFEDLREAYVMME